MARRNAVLTGGGTHARSGRGIRSLFWYGDSPTRGFRVLSALVAIGVGTISVFSLAGAATAATTAVHEITTNWVGNPAAAPYGAAVTSEWHISTNDATNPQANNPVDNVRVTLTATNGVFSSIPAVCKTKGVTPVSSISANGTTLVCNLGTITEGTASVIQAPVRATGGIGSKLSVSGTVTSDSAVATAGPAATPGLPITGTHGMDLVLSAPNQNYQQSTISSRSGGNRPSIVVDYGVAMTTGSIPGPSTYSFTVDIAVSVAGQLPGLQWEGCAPVDNSAQATGIPYSASTFPNRTNAPTCTISGSGTHYTVTLSGLDYSLQQVPTTDSLGNAIPSTSTFVASGQLHFSYTSPITSTTGVTFGATPTPFTFTDGVTQAETNTSNDVSGTTLVTPGVFSMIWMGSPTAGRSPWDANLWAAPGTAQTKTFPWPAAGSSTNPGPYTLADQPLGGQADSVTWSTYSGAGGADLAGSCVMIQNPAAFTPRYVDFLAADGASYSNMTTAHLWYRTDALNTKTETCGEPVGVAGSPWISAPLPAGCSTQTASISPAYSDDKCIVSVPAGVTAVKMTWNPAVDKQFHHFLRVWGYVPPTAPIGAESWVVGAFNAPYNTATTFPGYPNLNNYINISTNPNVIATIPGSTYGPNTNGIRDAMRIQGPTGAITKTTASTTAQPGVPITYNLSAEADLAVQSPPNQSFTVTDTLPAGMTYVAGSGSPAPTVTTNGSGQQVLSYTFTNVPANTAQPITYQAQTASNSAIAPGTVLTNTAEVDVPGDNRPAAVRQATASVTVPNNGATTLGKSVEANTLSFYGDSSAWDLLVSSQDPVNNPYTDTIDILPSTADGRGTTIDGTYTVTGVTAVAGATVYYSTASPASLSNDPRAASNGGTPGSITGNTVGWTTVKPAKPTAVRVIGPALAPGATQNIRIAFTTPAGTSCAAPASSDNKPGQVMVNSANSIAGHTGLPMLSSATTTIGDCYALDLKKYVLAKGGTPTPADPSANSSWMDANTVAGFAQYAVGDSVPFEVIATNKGTGTLTNVVVSDPQAPGCGGTIASLAPGATQVFACQLTASVGTTVNTASASVTPPSGPALNVSDPAGFVVPSPYVVKKTSDAGAAAAPGSIVHYTVTVTEPATSAAPAVNPSISDDLSAVLDDATYNGDAASSAGSIPTVTGNTLAWTAASLMPGQTITITYSVTVNSPDTGDKLLKNTVVTPAGVSNCAPGSVDPTCSVTTPVETYTVAKSASPAATIQGGVVTYTVTVANTGQAAYAATGAGAASFRDALSGVTDDAAYVPGSATASAGVVSVSGTTISWAGPLAVAPAAGSTVTITYQVKVDSPDTGDLTLNNTAVPTGSGGSCAATGCSTSTPVQIPAIALVKSATPTTITAAGQPVTYTFAVTNTGNVALSGVTVTDTAFSGTGPAPAITCPAAAASLAPGATVTCTATYVATQADVDAGQVTNTATATGTPPNGPAPVSPPSTAVVTAAPAPAISVVKSATPNDAAHYTLGQVISYSFVVTNTGNVTLTEVGIAEGAFTGSGAMSPAVCPAGAASLAPGAQVVCTATYTITQADVDRGSLQNTATADGTSPSGGTVTSPPSTVKIPAPSTPAISLVKSATPTTITAAGQTVTYSFLVTNTGNVTLTNPAVTETAFSGTGTAPSVTCPPATLLPGGRLTCTTTYVATQADVDAGSITNTATAAGTPPTGSPVTSTPSTATVTAAPAPGISLVKTATPATAGKVGDQLTYSFLVTNTGNTTLTDVKVSEGAFTGTGTLSPAACPAGAASLAPGASVTCTASYTLTQADVDAGTVSNTATATGTPPSGPPPVSPPSTFIVPIPPASGITVTKTATPNTAGKVGDKLTYSFLVRNTGNTTLTNVTVDEGAFSGTGTLSAVTCPAVAASLAPGASVTCTATYTLTQADVDAGQVSNTATATGTPPSGPPPVSPPSTFIVPIPPASGIAIVKTANPATVGKAGDTVAYSFRVTNTGNTTLTGVTVNEGAFTGTGTLSAVTCPAGAASLAPGVSVICTASYTLTQADVDAGQVANTATATGTDPSGSTEVSQPSTAIVGVTPDPSISVVKSASPSDAAHYTVGQVVTYSFLVTNTGNTTLTNVGIDEGAFTGSGSMSPATCPAGASSLAPGAQVTCTATYTITQADVDRGSVQNTATARGTDPSGTTVTSPPDTVTIPAPADPSIALVKSASPATITAAGQTVTYSFEVTNTGNVTLSNVSVTDTAFTGTGTPPAITCPAGAASLAPGRSVTCTAAYVATQADVDAGQVTNTATAAGTPPTGAAVSSPPSTAVVTATPAPALTMVKSATPSDAAHFTVGQVITYTFLITNTGNTTLTGVHPTEGGFDGSGALSTPTCPAGAASLSPGAQVACTATYTLTQADVDHGSITNDATATGNPPSGPPPVSPPSNVTLPAPSNPAISLVKSVTPAVIAHAGDTVTYSFQVTNTGNVTLTDPAVTETAFSGTGAAPVPVCAPTALVPGASVTCTATYVATQADVDAGTITNTATATGTPPSGPAPVSPPSSAKVTATPAPGITLVKSATPATITAPGQTVTYSFVVTNTGNVTLANASVTDTAFSGTGPLPAIACPAGAASLAPGASLTCTATYSPTQADVDAGQLTNTATATGTPPTGPAPVSPPSTAIVTATPAPALTVFKSATPSDAAHFTVGRLITYTFVITNTGNVTLANVHPTEGTFTGSGALSAPSCPAGAASLAPGAQVSCTATYTITQADVDRGSITNDVTATGTPPSGPPPVSPPSKVTLPAPSAPAITVVKSATPATITAAGQTVTYSFVVTNTGNVTLTNPAVTETAFTGTGTAPIVTCPPATLTPGAQVTCTATYAATQADVDAGSVSNTATASGTTPTGSTVTSKPSTATVTATPAPGISLVKSATPATAGTAGDQVTYSFLITNTGNTTLTDVTVNEGAFSGTGTLSAATCPAGAASLAPSAAVTCTATYTLTQADVDAGTVTNTATATGTSTTGAPVTSPKSTVSVTIPEAPALSIVKSATPNDAAHYTVGQTIAYSFVITNTGNTTLTNVGIDEGAFTGSGTMSPAVCPAGAAALAPNAQVICTAGYTLTQADVDHGSLQNTASSHGTSPSGAKVSSPQSQVAIPAPSNPALTLRKTATPATITAAGQTVTYSFLVTNTGNVTLTDPRIDETAFSGTGATPVAVCPAGSLVPGQSITCTATYKATQADVDAGTITNTATASADTSDGVAVTSPASSARVDVAQTPAITVVKSASPSGPVSFTAGHVITYSFVITNTGNTTLKDVVPTEGAFSGSGTMSAPTCPAGAASLAPGAQVTCTATYALTQADVDAGKVTNTATATGTSPSGEKPVSPPSTVSIPDPPAPAVSVVKTASTAHVTAVGQVVTYSFAITNTGNVSLTDVKPIEGAFTGKGVVSTPTCPAAAASLLPGATVVCTATYTVVQGDLVAGGNLSNTATAVGTALNGGTVTSPPSVAKVLEDPAVVTPPAAGPPLAATGSVIGTSRIVVGTGLLGAGILLVLLLWYRRRRNA
ncbi:MULTISPECIES: isopeptide-forming domain-containing fimbrial protein [unclassified Leifsonia]|uniref:DUF7507 domain-containing protein n=1 Tax=unclassified Leifsonia TaxID=2663824 RepID=UPI0008A764E3|nr:MULTISPECIES: isopeptide-forming domain-containing fimbrial protein [unclassified Leifsonia]SEH57123.1 conserved repeat domain-containing protein [Leifsonia sp. CL154]SFL21724.1 conserved repeat domain-containing protein [Leifsonia sp. CL147]